MGKSRRKPINNEQSPLVQLPPELREPIIKRLCLNDALQLRLTCKQLNYDVENFYDRFKLEICGDSLNISQLNFIWKIYLRKITFKRIAKPLHSMNPVMSSYPPTKSWMGSKKTIYDGPSQFIQVGGIQVRSIEVSSSQYVNPGAKNPLAKIKYDYGKLRRYLCDIGCDDVFGHM